MNVNLSQEIIEASQLVVMRDPIAAEIGKLTEEIEKKRDHLIELEGQLLVIKRKRPQVAIKWRDSVRWCLIIDAENPKFFLKNVDGICRCVSFKHKTDITADMRNKIATTLSMMFKEDNSELGRIEVNNEYYYGLARFFESDLVTLKKKHLKLFEENIKP